MQYASRNFDTIANKGDQRGLKGSDSYKAYPRPSTFSSCTWDFGLSMLETKALR